MYRNRIDKYVLYKIEHNEVIYYGKYQSLDQIKKVTNISRPTLERMAENKHTIYYEKWQIKKLFRL